jgi:hypothetical protein
MRSSKLLLALATLAILATSCKKSYTCTCYEPYKSTAYEIQATSKDDAQDACNSYDEPVWRTCTLTEGYYPPKKKK